MTDIREQDKDKRLDEMRKDEKEFVEHIKKNPQYLKPVLAWMRDNKVGDCHGKFKNIEGTNGTEGDFGGFDLKLHFESSVVTGQYKRRVANPTATHPRTGMDGICEFLRMYRFGSDDDFRVVIRPGRDLIKVARVEHVETVAPYKGVVNSDDAHHSELYIVNPERRPGIFWCDSQEVKNLAWKFYKRVHKAFLEDDEQTVNRIKSLFRPSTGVQWNHDLDCLQDMSVVQRNPDLKSSVTDYDQVQVSGRLDPDKKECEMNGKRYSAAVAKWLIFFPPTQVSCVSTEEIQK